MIYRRFKLGKVDPTLDKRAKTLHLNPYFSHVFGAAELQLPNEPFLKL